MSTPRLVKAIVGLVAACQWSCGETKSKDSSRSAEAEGEEASATAASEVGPKAPAAVASGFPWQELERCGLVDVLKTRKGDLLSSAKVSSRPFAVSAHLGGLPVRAEMVATLDLRIFVDKVVSTLVVQLDDPTPEIAALAKTLGEFAPPWTVEQVGYLPDLDQYAAINAKLGLKDAPCSVIPVVRRTASFGKSSTDVTFDPGIPEILSTHLGLELLKDELGERRSFPAVRSVETKIDEKGVKSTSESDVSVTILGALPSADELKALALEGDPSEFYAYRMQTVSSGQAGDESQMTRIFDAATGKTLGGVLVRRFAISEEPLIIAFPPLESKSGRALEN